MLAKSKEWHDARLKGIGGSEISDVLSLEPYGCAARLFDEKRNVPPDFDIPHNPNMERGVMLEDIVCDIYAQQTGDKLIKSKALKSKEYPFMLGNVDRFIEKADTLSTSNTTKGVRIRTLPDIGILEVKCPNRNNYLRIKRLGLPESYILQLQHYLYIADKQWAVWAIFCADMWELLPVPVERDNELIQMIIEEEERFWKMVENGPRPDRLEPDDKRCKKCCRKISCWGDMWRDDDTPEGIDDDYVEVNDDDFIAAYREHTESISLVKEAEEVKEESRQKLIDVIGNDREMLKCDLGKVTYKWQKRTGFDKTKLKKEHPDIIEKYSYEGGSLTLRTYPRKEG